MKMHYRLLHDKGSSLTASTEEEDLHQELFDAALDVVAMAFAKMVDQPVKIDGMTPEILCDATMRRIEIMEGLIEQMRNLMIDAHEMDDGHRKFPEWSKVVDEAADVLGYSDADR